MSRPPFDLSRLTPEERAVWDEYCADGEGSMLIKVWSFGYICMLVLEGRGRPTS
jgi:hypothetical protein